MDAPDNPPDSQQETDPDPRYSLANERTYLAWVRTVLTVVAGAVALHFLEIPESDKLRDALVIAMLVFAALMMLLAHRRWQLVERAMRLGRTAPSSALGAVMTTAVVVTALLLAVSFF